MSDDGATFEIDIPVKGTPAIDAAAASIEKLEGSGTAASKALIATSDAIKAGEASYSKAEKSVDAASKALERIQVAAAGARGKLQFAVGENDAAAAEKAAKQLRYLTQQEEAAKTRVDAANAALKQQATAFDKLGRSEEKVVKTEKEHEIKLGGVARGLKKLGGPLGEGGAKVFELGHAWERLSGAFGKGGAAGIVGAVGVAALAAAVVALAVAVAVGVVKFAAWAVGLADANRSAALLAQGIARSVDGGNALDNKISDLTRRLPLTREELTATASELAKAGYRGNDLTTALQRSAIAAAKLKFGPGFEDQMLSLDEQSKVFHENLSAIFGGLKIDNLLRGLQKLGNLFDESSASGKALKAIFESLFQPIIDGAANAVPKVERFFIQLEILALRGLIAIKPYGSTILKIGEALAIGAAVIAGVLAGAIVLVVGLVGGLVAGFGALLVFVSKVQLAMNDLGLKLIEGLVNGIVNGATAVVNAVKGTVQGAIDGAKSLLGIHSPSKVFAEIGAQTGAGMSQGVERASGGVADSFQGMIAPPTSGGPGAPTAASISSSRSVGDISITVNAGSGASADDIAQRIREELTRILEGDAAQFGAVSPA